MRSGEGFHDKKDTTPVVSARYMLPSTQEKAVLNIDVSVQEPFLHITEKKKKKEMIRLLACTCAILHFLLWEFPTYHCSLLIPLGSFPLVLEILRSHPHDLPIQFFMAYYISFHLTHLLTLYLQ